MSPPYSAMASVVSQFGGLFAMTGLRMCFMQRHGRSSIFGARTALQMAGVFGVTSNLRYVKRIWSKTSQRFLNTTPDTVYPIHHACLVGFISLSQSQYINFIFFFRGLYKGEPNCRVSIGAHQPSHRQLVEASGKGQAFFESPAVALL